LFVFLPGLRLLVAMLRSKWSYNRHHFLRIPTMILCLSALAVGCAPVQVQVSTNKIENTAIKKQPEAVSHAKRANFESESKSRDAQNLADWVVDSGDNGNMPFMIIDKIEAKAFVFGTDGRLRGASPVLLGLAKGDRSVPGIGTRKLSSIRPEERTTPAGRFVASLGRNAKGKDILWVDYDGALSLHRVVPIKARLQRLSTPTPLDNRISYGCINVPVKFYDNVVHPAFTGARGVVYILPETLAKKEIFTSYYDIH
jgi:hypothetical protein